MEDSSFPASTSSSFTVVVIGLGGDDDDVVEDIGDKTLSGVGEGGGDEIALPTVSGASIISLAIIILDSWIMFKTQV